MIRKIVMAADWKMNLTMAESVALAEKIAESSARKTGCEIILFPSFLHLGPVAQKIRGTSIGLGGQNLYYEEKGAYTGEVAAFQLKDIGCSHVLIGHSERRHYFQEGYETVNRKIRAAISHELKVLLCVGESLEERESGLIELVVIDQIESAMENIPVKNLEDIMIAYEPIWAIGTGKHATPADAANVHRVIRKTLARIFDVDSASRMSILYGGSVKSENIADFLVEDNIDGALVGGASLDAQGFLELIEKASAL